MFQNSNGLPEQITFENRGTTLSRYVLLREMDVGSSLTLSSLGLAGRKKYRVGMVTVWAPSLQGGRTPSPSLPLPKATESPGTWTRLLSLRPSTHFLPAASLVLDQRPTPLSASFDLSFPQAS